MSAGHSHPLHRPGDTPVHRMAPQVKVVAAVAGVLCVVSTPRERFWAFGLYLAVLAGVWVLARIPPGWLAKRALIEAPFVVLAFAFPFLAGGPTIDVLGVALSEHGLLSGWNIVVKGTLGVLVSLTLAATTTPGELIVGLQRLRVPTMVITIATLMLRYLDVIAAEARRMRIARICRGHDPRFLWQVGATARGIGTLFIRSYERGERVHLAMVSRGWTGAMPDQGRPAGRAAWLLGLAPTALAAVVLGIAL
ncbi:cobalt ECF transporter T component CbiQ [Actinokineospora globicatena]|uniref:Cobalt ECF transporter T component CbiQ n=1 Tax=Actinokineospora globicatena TaxID=103729 RepID=A0A9W6V8B5_9PSEU|nr:cobalt ECF transporter T component CbiQ [Actinokineospora globicatena]GLW90784.1 cobalt ECF transporter T component CbiQ [Actinokineospora globicatena]